MIRRFAYLLVVLNIVVYGTIVIGPSKFLPPGYFDGIIFSSRPSTRGGSIGILPATTGMGTELKSAPAKTLQMEPNSASAKTIEISETPTDTNDVDPVDVEAFVKLLPYDISAPPSPVLRLFRVADYTEGSIFCRVRAEPSNEIDLPFL